MSQHIGMHSILVMTALFSVGSATPWLNIEQQYQHLGRNINSQYLALSWNDIWNLFRHREASGGGRGGQICTIAPGKLDNPESKKEGSQEIWSLKPVFFWNIQGGTAQKIELFEKGSNEPFWIREIPAGETKVIYDGSALKTGHSYQWQLDANVPFPIKSISEFKVMESEQRDRITQELTQLEERLKEQKASAESIALEKVNYFAQQELWTDALSEIYSVQNSSPELIQTIEQIQAHDFCAKDQPNASGERSGTV